VTYPGHVDRDAIERRDFPVVRRGYDQAAVDAHLRRVADELEARRGRPPAAPRTSLAAGTSEQVRAILEAAESSAAELRADAGRRASGYVARVEEAAGGMLARLDELERELGTLLDALGRSGERLTEGLARLQREVRELPGAAVAADVPPATVAVEESVPGPDPGEPPVPEEDFAAAAPAPVEPSANGDEAGAAPAPAADPASDEAGARLIALNMALSGTPREETARYLGEHFALADPEALLDDVYARAGQ
jgi:DivIVA domain-containing protein